MISWSFNIFFLFFESRLKNKIYSRILKKNKAKIVSSLNKAINVTNKTKRFIVSPEFEKLNKDILLPLCSG